jgi:hypothetical protein
MAKPSGDWHSPKKFTMFRWGGSCRCRASSRRNAACSTDSALDRRPVSVALKIFSATTVPLFRVGQLAMNTAVLSESASRSSNTISSNENRPVELDPVEAGSAATALAGSSSSSFARALRAFRPRCKTSLSAVAWNNSPKRPLLLGSSADRLLLREGFRSFRERPSTARPPLISVDAAAVAVAVVRAPVAALETDEVIGC